MNIKLSRFSFAVSLILFLLVDLSSKAQGEDSLRLMLSHTTTAGERGQALAKLSFMLASEKPDTALFLANQAINIAGSLKSEAVLAAGYSSAGWCYFRLGKKDSAEKYLVLARNIFYKTGSSNDEAKCLANLSSVYCETKNYEKALNCLLPARTIFEKAGNQKSLAYIDKQVGILYRSMGDYKRAKESLRSGIFAFSKLGALNYLGDSYSSYGTVCLLENNYDSALMYYRQAFTIFKDSLKNTSNEAYAAENMGDAFSQLTQAKREPKYGDSAYYYYAHALANFKEIGSTGNMKFEQVNLASVLIMQKQYKPAEQLLLESYSYYDSTDDAQMLEKVSQQLSFLYRDIGDYENAYRFDKVFDNWRDTIDVRNRADSMASMFARYETEKKDRTIQLLNAQQKISDQQIANQRLIEIFSVIAIMLGGMLFFLVYNRVKIKQQLKDVQLRNQIAADLHDDIGSSLSSILLLSKMASSNQSGSTIPILEKISGNAKEVIERMGEIVWMMNPRFDKGEKLHEKLEQLILNVKQVAPIGLQVETYIDDKISSMDFTMELRKSIYLISKEALNNVLKYASARHLSISLTLANKQLVLEIKDDGAGMDMASVKAGNGLETMKHRAETCKAQFKISAAPGQGTSVRAEFHATS